MAVARVLSGKIAQSNVHWDAHFLYRMTQNYATAQQKNVFMDVNPLSLVQPVPLNVQTCVRYQQIQKRKFVTSVLGNVCSGVIMVTQDQTARLHVQINVEYLKNYIHKLVTQPLMNACLDVCKDLEDQTARRTAQTRVKDQRLMVLKHVTSLELVPLGVQRDMPVITVQMNVLLIVVHPKTVRKHVILHLENVYMDAKMVLRVLLVLLSVPKIAFLSIMKHVIIQMKNVCMAVKKDLQDRNAHMNVL
jgi:hypothetical protein